jgi:ribosomal protein L33
MSDPINDVRRKLNEVLNKQDQRLVFGWKPGAEPARKEGETWEDVDGRNWTVRNGIKQSISKLETAKTPWFCPKCNKVMNHKIDDKFWRLRGHCFDCNVKVEMQIRKEGKWKEYEESLMKANFIAQMKDMLQRLTHIRENLSAPEVIHFDEHEKRVMMVEKWDVDLNKIREDLEKDITKLEKNIAKAEAGDFTDEDIG